MDRQSGAEGLVEYILKVSRQKENKRFYVLIIQGFLAGLFIAIGAIACLKVSSSITPPGLGSFLGALVFPLGIIAIVFMPAELFTSDCLIVTSVYAGRTKALKTAGVLCLVFVANVLGALFAAFLTKLSGIFDSATADLSCQSASEGNARHPIVHKLYSRNIIVCTGVCLHSTARRKSQRFLCFGSRLLYLSSVVLSMLLLTCTSCSPHCFTAHRLLL